jgi:hypothetical protein
MTLLPQQHAITKSMYVLGAITALLMVVNVFMSARVAQDGLEIDSLSQKQVTLQNDIRLLEQQVISQTSLNDLSAKAEQLGYVSPTMIVSVNSAAPLAYNR